MTMSTKVLIVDDHPAVREGLAVRIRRSPTWRSAARPPISPRPWIWSGRPPGRGDRRHPPQDGQRPRPDRAAPGPQQIDPHPRLVDVSRRRLRAVGRSGPGAGLYQQGNHHGPDRRRHSPRARRQDLPRRRDGRHLLCEHVAGRSRARPTGLDALSDRELEVFRLIGQGHDRVADCGTTSPQQPHGRGPSAGDQAQAESEDRRGVNREAVQWMLEHG